MFIDGGAPGFWIEEKPLFWEQAASLTTMMPGQECKLVQVLRNDPAKSQVGIMVDCGNGFTAEQWKTIPKTVEVEVKTILVGSSNRDGNKLLEDTALRRMDIVLGTKTNNQLGLPDHVVETQFLAKC